MTEKKTVETPNTLNQMFDLLNEGYKTYLKSLVWGQERVLEFTKVLVKQAETTQEQGRGLVEEYGKQIRHGSEIVRDAFEQATRNNTNAIKEAQDFAEKNINEVAEKVNNTAKAAAKNN
jgi:polyhydroxyalkanoate synthesis regulator phasin